MKLVAARYGRSLLLTVALLASALYLWQVANAWSNQDKLDQSESGMSIHSLEAIRNTSAAELMGIGLGAGAMGTLAYDRGGVKGVLVVRDLPTLPASQIYEIWCSDYNGKVAASNVFRVPADSRDSFTVVMSVPRPLGNYIRFFITVEPASGNLGPTGPVVMQNWGN